MTGQDQLAMIDTLLARAFPVQETQEGSDFSGPGYHLRALQASRDFWDDRSEEAFEAAMREIGAAQQALVAALTSRWGEPEPVDLQPYLWAEGATAPPMDHLCQLSEKMLVWRPPTAHRWVALAVGQADREFPIELLAAVSDTPIQRPAR